MSAQPKTVLMVDDEKSFLMSAKEGIEVFSDQLNILTAFHGKDAVQMLDESPVDLVVTDLKMPQMDGFELMAHMSKNYRNIPVLVMTAFGTPEIQKRVKRLGAVHYMEKPVSINDLLDNIIDALSENAKSYIHGFSLGNFLQLVEIEEKTLALRISAGNRIGHLYINEGVLIDAETDNSTGKEAAIEIIGWENSEIEILDGISRSQGSINASIMHILLECSKSMDEQRADTKAEERSPVNQAAALAEGHYYAEARELLSTYLKENPDDAQGWLWYSRITGSMRHIATALSNALKLAPEDSVINNESRKYLIAQQTLGEGQYPRCPFCWSPVTDKDSNCYYCKGYYRLTASSSQVPDGAMTAIFQEAMQRYSRVLDREDNNRARFYMAMVKFNLQQWEEALDLMNAVVKSAPKNQYYTDQLNILLDLMASTGDETEEVYDVNDLESATATLSEQFSGPKTILVVEDSSTTRKVICITLAKEGYDVIEASDGIEAVNHLNDTKPDLILLDIILPRMDGYKVLSIIRENPDLRNVPVIMLTSRDGLLNKVRGKMAGSTAYLTKPFEPKKLLETIQKYLN